MMTMVITGDDDDYNADDDGDCDLMMMVVSHQMKTSPQRMLRARSMKFAVSSKKSVIGAAGRS